MTRVAWLWMLGWGVLSIGASLVGTLLGWAMTGAFVGIAIALGVGGFFIARNEWVARQRKAWIDEVHAYMLKRIDLRTYPDETEVRRYYDALRSYDDMLYRWPWQWDREQFVQDRRRYAEVRGWGPEQ